MKSNSFCILKKIRDAAGPRQTQGLDDLIIEKFLEIDPKLESAIINAKSLRESLQSEYGGLFSLAEEELGALLQRDYLSFYGPQARCPYVPLSSAGPWVVTTHGAVLHDSGGYGMLGHGHSPAQVVDALSIPHTMANIMTPSISQLSFSKRLKKEIGHTKGSCPYTRFLCMNSGSESVTVAARICDLNAFNMTQKGASKYGKKIATLSLTGSFHGRTELAARVSESTFKKYKSHLASYRSREDLYTVEANDVSGLQDIFDKADAENIYFDSCFLEPVLGEGIPGLSLTPEFYNLARNLTKKHGTFLIVDSIQAGLRATGHLSIVDYPGFEGFEPPEMETYSKALNGGQYPLSVLAMTSNAAECYVEGIYGNTMTGNPKALDVGSAVLDSITNELRLNIQNCGRYFLDRLNALKREFPKHIVSVHGTGLIVCADINSSSCKVIGQDGLEGRLRRRGISIVHAGENGMRFTPHFAITKAEIDMIIDVVKQTLSAI